MDVLRLLGLCTLAAFMSGCQVTYLMKSAKSHLSIMWNRVPIEEALKDPRLTEEQKNRLRRAVEARQFAIEKLGLKAGTNYTRFSYLDRPYVSYVVSAAPAWKLEHYEWRYPIVGKMPYRGYASEEDAKAEEKVLREKGLDTFLRGVSAYSTLGWFEDPILSTMLDSKEYRLVNVIIHETVHSTLYIKNSADFNERLAVFIGNKGTEQFYLLREGSQSPTVQMIKDENHDDALFSAFIGPEIEALKKWYEQLPMEARTEDKRQSRIREIQQSFEKKLLPTLKTDNYKRFPETSLNNARLMYFRTYMEDLSDFERLYSLVSGDWNVFLRCAKSLEKVKDPEKGLKELVARLTESPQEPSNICP